MNFLNKLGIGKKKEQEPEVVTQEEPKKKKFSITQALIRLNKPMAGGFGMDGIPRRTPMELQLGIPEYTTPITRFKKFDPKMSNIEEHKKPKKIKKSRPLPGKPYNTGW